MRFGINSFLFTSPFTTKSTSLIPKFKKMGFDTVELPADLVFPVATLVQFKSTKLLHGIG